MSHWLLGLALLSIPAIATAEVSPVGSSAFDFAPDHPTAPVAVHKKAKKGVVGWLQQHALGGGDMRVRMRTKGVTQPIDDYLPREDRGLSLSTKIVRLRWRY